LDLELLALSHSEESEDGDKDILHGEHVGTAVQGDERNSLDSTPALLLILRTTRQRRNV
jgi:hypothetical protein